MKHERIPMVREYWYKLPIYEIQRIQEYNKAVPYIELLYSESKADVLMEGLALTALLIINNIHVEET